MNFFKRFVGKGERITTVAFEESPHVSEEQIFRNATKLLDACKKESVYASAQYILGEIMDASHRKIALTDKITALAATWQAVLYKRKEEGTPEEKLQENAQFASYKQREIERFIFNKSGSAPDFNRVHEKMTSVNQKLNTFNTGRRISATDKSKTQIQKQK